MSGHFDALETRDPELREATLFEALRAQVANAQTRAPGMARHLAGVQADEIKDREALAQLPVLRKSDLAAHQKADPPFGGLTTRAPEDFELQFQSPGPIYEPGMITAPDWWRFGRAFHAAGFRHGDLLHNSFAYHLTPAGHMMESGARAVGAAVVAGGVGNTEAQAIAAADLRVTGYVGTPDFLKALLDKGTELGRDLSRITRALVGGGPLFPAMRQEYRDRGISCLQNYGTADLGLIAYETASVDGGANEGMVVDEGVILEIVRPGTGDPAPDGEVGEVLVTMLNPDYPLIRFATGDMSAALAGISPLRAHWATDQGLDGPVPTKLQRSRACSCGRADRRDPAPPSGCHQGTPDDRSPGRPGRHVFSHRDRYAGRRGRARHHAGGSKTARRGDRAGDWYLAQ